jgi:hypothetical protein
MGPNQYGDQEIPPGKVALITDIYIDNLGGGVSFVEILEQRSTLPVFEVRYCFRTQPNEKLVINLTTGLPLGDEAPITGVIRVRNSLGSAASVLVRVNGIILP